MRIGYTNDSYPEQRTFLEHNPNKMVRLKSFNSYYIGAAQKKIPLLKKHSRTVFYETIFDIQQVEGLHFFNSITASKKPWISSYETCIPRLSRMSFLQEGASSLKSQKEIRDAEKYVKIVAGDSCRKIIALSKINQSIQEDFLEYFPLYKNEILSKMIQLYPPQKR